MEDIFGQLDIVKILGFGLSGLSLLLMVLAYRLNKEAISKPDRNAISLAKFYLITTIVVIVVVGIFSIPIAGRNSQLSADNRQLTTDKQKLADKTNVLLLSEEVHSKLDDIQRSTNPDTIRQGVDEVRKLNDSLTTTAERVDPGLAAGSKAVGREIDSFAVNASHPPTPDVMVAVKSQALNLQKSLKQFYFAPIKKSVAMQPRQ